MLKNIKKLDSGQGGECVLVRGSEKTAVIDTGMAFGGQRLVKILKQELGCLPLDYILLSHSHYDHAGGVPYLKKAWPSVKVAGAGHAQKVFLKESALAAIRRMGEIAAKEYRGASYCPLSYEDEDLKVDWVLSEGELVSLGDRSLLVLATPGHTACSLTYFLKEEGIMFPCESIGCYAGNRVITAPILTGFSQSLASIEKCRSYEPRSIISPHYGLVEEVSAGEYFALAEKEAYEVKDFILKYHRLGYSEERILNACTEYFWRQRESVRRNQPLGAFTVNTEATIKTILREFA